MQKLHARAPFIAVWDDHEIANDAFNDSAFNHDESTTPYYERKINAIRAYFEWMPIRPLDVKNGKIYRHFEFGSLVNLIMLDTRLLAREKQLNYDKDGALLSDLDEFKKILNEERELLGSEQERWLDSTLKASNAKWQVLGQQVLMAKLHIPLELMPYLMLLTQKNPDKFYMDAAINLYELYRLKQKEISNVESLSESEKERLRAVPYTLHAWDGYSRCRDRVYKSMLESGKDVVVLSGDSHNAWANSLTIEEDGQSIPVGIEFATPSVTSDGMEAYARVQEDSKAKMLEKAAITLVDDLKYLNANNRGFMVVTFNQNEVTTEWFFVDTVKSKEYAVLEDRSAKRISKIKTKTISKPKAPGNV